MIGIYKIENKINGKVYIGQSKCIEYRWWRHKRDLNANEHENHHLQNSWNKNGEAAFDFILIEECSEDDLNDREIYWIQQYDSYHNGYNLTLGGGGTKYIIPLLQFDLTGNFIKEWDDVYTAATTLEISPTTIYGCCNKRYKHAGKYIWIFKKDYVDKNSLAWYLENQHTKNVDQYDLYGNFIKRWDCQQDIKRELGLSVANCCLHKTYSCGGYIFKFSDDNLELTEEYCYFVRNVLKLLNSKSFYQVDKNANIIKHYISLNDAVLDGYSERCINECCRGLRDKYKGYIWVLEENIDSITIDYCNKIFNNKQQQKNYTVLQYDLNNNFIKEFPYLCSVKKEGFNENNVRDCCLNRKLQYKGFIWRFGKDIIHPMSNEVLQYDLNGKFINSFYSLNYASQMTGIAESNIGLCCNGNTMSSGGYIFKYKKDNILIDDDYCRLARNKAKIYKLVAINYKTKEIEIFENQKDVDLYKYKLPEILKCCNGIKSFYKDKVWFNYYDYIKMTEEQVQKRLKAAFDFNDNRIICLNTHVVFDTCIDASIWANVASCCISQASTGKSESAGVDKDTGERLYWMKYKDYLKINSNDKYSGELIG